MSVDGDDRAVSDRSEDRERERERDDRDREESEPEERGKSEQPAEEFKIFVGGISWHMDDRELKDSESITSLHHFCSFLISHVLYFFCCNYCWFCFFNPILPFSLHLFLRAAFPQSDSVSCYREDVVHECPLKIGFIIPAWFRYVAYNCWCSFSLPFLE